MQDIKYHINSGCKIIFTAGVILSALISINCCSNIQPIYYNNKYQDKLNAIQLKNIQCNNCENLLSYNLQQSLNNIFINHSTNPEYSLNIYCEKKIDAISMHSDSIATRNNISLILKYTLEDVNTAKTLETGIIQNIDSLEILPSPYSTFISEEEMSIRIVKECTEELKKRLLLYFTSNKS